MATKAKATTLTIQESTRRRLADYKRGDSTFDDVLNKLMDAVPLEDVMEDDIREHYARLKEGDFISTAEMKRRLTRMLESRGVRSPARSAP